MRIIPVSVPVESRGKTVLLMVNPTRGKADVLIDGSPSGVADVDIASGAVAFQETAVERLSKSGFDPAAVTDTAGDAVWVECRATEAFDAANLAGNSRAQAWAAMNATAIQYADLAQRATATPKEKARAERTRARVVELAQQFK